MAAHVSNLVTRSIGVPLGGFHGPDEPTGLRLGADSPFVPASFGYNIKGIDPSSSYGMLWQGSSSREDGAWPGNALRAPRCGQEPTALPTGPDTLLPSVYSRGLSSRQERSGVSRSHPRSAFSVHPQHLKDDCGSAPVADLLNADDTSSSNHSPSSSATSSFDSQTDLVALGSSSSNASRIAGRPYSFQPLPPDAKPLFDGGDYLRQETARALDESRHHGGDVAAAALMGETFRCQFEGAGSAADAQPCRYSADPQQLFRSWHSLELPSVGSNEKPLCGCTISRSFSSSFRGLSHACSQRLSRLPEEEPLVPERLAELVPSPGAGRRSSGAGGTLYRRRSSSSFGEKEGILLSAAAGGAAVFSTRGSLSEGLPPAPLSSAAGASDGTKPCPASPSPPPPPPLRTQLSQPSASTAAPFGPTTTAMPPPLPATPSDPIAVRPYGISSPAAATAAAAAVAGAFHAGVDFSPFAAVAYDGTAFLDHELPDDSVHGGRPRHPSFAAAAAPSDSQLLEWAESESAAAAAAHLSGTAERSTHASATARFNVRPSEAAPPPAPPPAMHHTAPAPCEPLTPAPAAARGPTTLLRALRQRLHVQVPRAAGLTGVPQLAPLGRALFLCVSLPLLLVWVGLLQSMAAWWEWRTGGGSLTRPLAGGAGARVAGSAPVSARRPRGCYCLGSGGGGGGDGTQRRGVLREAAGEQGSRW